MESRGEVLWCLGDLNLADTDILHWEDRSAGLFNFLTQLSGNNLFNEVINSGGGGLLVDNILHSSVDLQNLGLVCVGSFLDLQLSLLGNTQSKDTHLETVSSLDVNSGGDESVQLLNQRSELIVGESQTVENSQSLLAFSLSISDSQSNQLVLLFFFVHQVSS